ncbi:MAG: hypothetical protein AMXMBFR33_22030 [Candidatus Xenobia bacterium]
MRNLVLLVLLVVLQLGVEAQPLTLRDLLEQVEAHHPVLRQADLALEMARARVTEKEGAFDPTLALSSGYQRYNSSSDPGKAKEAFTNGMEVAWTTPSGIKLGAGMDLNRGDVKSPASLTGEGGTYFLEAKIPLIQGFEINEKSIAWQQAMLGLPLAEADRELVRLGLLRSAGESYWDWASAWQMVDVNQRLLDLADERLAVVRQRVEAGDLAPIDVAETEQELERRRGLLTRFQRLSESTSLKLAFFLWQNEKPPGREQAPPQLDAPRPLSLQEEARAREDAMQLRPEFRGLKVQREIVWLDERLAENNQRPALNVIVSPGLDVGNQGVGPVFKGGLELVIPLQTREADGKLALARLKIQDLDLKTLLQTRKVLLEVEDALSAVRAAYQRFLAAERELELARQVEEGERYRFSMGDSTVFLVNQRERATAEAELRRLEVQGEYLKALVGLDASSGRLGEQEPAR